MEVTVEMEKPYTIDGKLRNIFCITLSFPTGDTYKIEHLTMQNLQDIDSVLFKLLTPYDGSHDYLT